MSDDKAKIRIAGLEKRFGENRVLQGVDLEVLRGRSTVVIGGSGTGKSVLLKCVLGLLDVDRGSIRIDNEEVVSANRATMEKLRRKFGMLFQGGALFDSIPVWHNVTFGLLASKRLARADARDKAVEILAKVGLAADVADKFPAELSGGMQKRVGLARAIASEPEIILFDEPTTGLDPIMADVINDLIRRCVGDLGATALSITHDMASVRKIADWIAMLYDGRIIWEGPASEIDQSGNDYVDQFVHGSAAGPISFGQSLAG